MDPRHDQPLSPRERAASAGAVLAALAVAAWLIAPRTRLPVSFDALHSYLPAARRVLTEGWAFLASPESLFYAPLAFLWPALLGAEPDVVRWANVGLFGAVIVLGFIAARWAHSWRAGALAALLLALSPTLRPFIGDVLTEPPFLFLMAAWIASVAALARGGGVAWVAAGGIALGLATLTRPAVMYFAPAMVAFFAWRALHRPVSERPPEWRLAALHGLAFALVAIWIARNAVTFGFPAVATGAGAALFFGVNPLVDGFDPQYFGMNYDTGGVHPDLTHLSIDSDRILRAVAAIQLFDTPLPVLLGMFARKSAAFIFVTTAETSGESILLQREWRILLVAGAAAAFAFHRRSTLVATLGALVAYMLVVHLPALYHHRYSVGALDLPLTLLAAIGFVEAAKGIARALPALAIAGLALVAGFVDASVTGPHAPKPERIPHLVRWQSEVKLTRRLEPGQAAVEIAIAKEVGTPPWDLSLLQLVLAVAPETRGAGCASFWLQFRGEEEAAYNPGRAVRIAVPAGSRPRTLNIGTTVPLVLDRAGTVRLTFDCRGPATLTIASAAVISPTRHLHYRDLYLERQAGS